MRASNCLLPSKGLSAVIAGILIWGMTSLASAQVVQADGTSAAGGQVEPASYSSSGSYYNREFGTPLRFSYHSEGYGTETGVVSLGTMKVFDLDGATWFLDGQGTMSDSFGGGFNAGVGYREMVDFNNNLDSQRILGASFWTDGQSTKADNFFTQLGFGLESLGESFDLRLNGYFPLDRTQTGDPKVTDFDTVTFSEHGLFSGLERTITDTAYDVVDGEFAKRVGDLDAWAFAAGYHLGGAGEDETGYRVGVRGYALPDLLVGLQVTDDSLYSTNVMFNLTWFVGRTHKGNANCGILTDRFREPVFRNDYVTTKATATSGGATELTDTETDTAFNFIHVNSTAAAGGDGTIESPFSTLEEAEAAQADNAYIYLHGGSTFAPTETIALNDNVNLWGEGKNFADDSISHVVDSVEKGTVTLPETSTGASELAAAVIDGSGAGTDLLVLGDDNDINNLTINDAMNAIVADSKNANVNATEAAEELADAAGNGINAPHLANIQINDATGTAIDLTQITATAIVENTVEINNAATGIHVDSGEEGMNINAAINDSSGSSLIVENRTGGTINYGGLITEGDGTSGNTDTDTDDSIVLRMNTDSTVNFTNTLSLNTSGTNRAVLIEGNNEASAFTFDDIAATAVDGNTFEMNDGGTLTINDTNTASSINNSGLGNAFTNTGSAELSTLDVAAAITNFGGGNAVNISGRTDNNVTFTNTVEDTESDGILLDANTGGTIAFDGKVTTTTSGTGNGVTIMNGGADVTYTFADLDIMTGSGTGFSATGDGTLEVTSAEGTNRIETGTGVALALDGLAIGANNVTIDDVVVTNGAAGSSAVDLANLDGDGQVIIGGSTAEMNSNTIKTAGTAFSLDNVDNVAISDVEVDNTGLGGNGISISNQVDGDTISASGVTIATDDSGVGLDIGTNTGGDNTFIDLAADTADGHAVSIHNNTGGTNVFTNLTASTSGSGDVVNMTTNDGATTTFNDMKLAAMGTGGGFVASGKGTIGVTSTPTTGGTSVTTASGQAVNLNDVTIDSTDVSIDKVEVTAGTTDSVSLVDLTGTGSVTLGADTADPGTITTSGRGVLVDGGANDITVNMDVTTSGASEAYEVTGRTGGTVTMNGTITGSGTGGINVDSNNGGTININDAITLDTGAMDAVTIVGNNGAMVSFGAGADVDLGATDGTGTTGSGVHLTGTNTNVSLAGNITGGSGTSLDIEGNAMATVGGNITNSAGRAFEYHNVTAGSVTVNGTITDNGGTGVSVDSNTGGTLTVNGKATLNTGNADALTISGNSGGTFTFDDVETTTEDGTGVNVVNNTGATVNLGGMDITATGTGVGFNATGGGTLQATGTNTVSTQSGVGVNINGMTIAGAGVAFNKVDVNAGTSNGITLTDTSGGPIRFGPAAATGVDGAGGMLNTAGSSIVMSGVRDVTFNDVTTNNSGAGTNSVLYTHTTSNPSSVVFNNLEATTVAGTGDAVVVNDNGSGELDFTLSDSNIDTQLSNSVGFLLEAGNSTGQVDVRVLGNAITGGTSSALSTNLDEGTGSVQFVLSDSVISSNSADPAASFIVDANRTLNATIGTADGSGTLLGNNFSNATGVGLRMETVSGSSAIQLDLRGNSASGGTFDYQIVETAGDFSVVEQEDTLQNQNQNSGTIDFGGGADSDFDDISSVPQPN